MGKLKVLQIITLSQWGGAQQVVFDLCCGLPKNKFLVEVACSSKGILVEKLRKKGIKVYEIPYLQREIHIVSDIKALFALYKIIKKNKYDIVHCHSTKAGFLGRVAAKMAMVKRIYFTAHGWAFYNKFEYGKKVKIFLFLQKFAALFTTRIICVSKQVMDDGFKNHIARQGKFQIIRNGIDFKENEACARLKRADMFSVFKAKISENDIVVTMVSRLAYPKNPLLFLRSANILINNYKYKQIKFALIGDGPYARKCAEFVDSNKLGQAVALLGEKDQRYVRSFLGLSNIFVLCSEFEGLPITIIEAMFAGLPVIASNVGGIGELVKNNKNGFLLEKNSSAELADKIIYLIKNKDLMREIKIHNLEKAKKYFSSKRMVNEYQSLYLS